MPNFDRPEPSGTVLITGAASGIGHSTAVLFAQKGWRCVLLDHDAQRLQQLQAELESHHPQGHLGRAVDLCDLDKIEAIAKDLPILDALINNAGISHSGASALEPLNEKVPSSLLALNLSAPARMVKACESRLRVGARVVNTTSGAALRAIPNRGLYSPSKAGLLAQTRALAQVKPHWTVTSLAPGFVRTELVQRLMDNGKLDPAQAVTKVPMGRMAEPDEMAHALYFLGAQVPACFSGQQLVVCGGSSVYGGSQKLPAAEYKCVPNETPLHLLTPAPLPGSWSGIDAETHAFEASVPGYVGVIDASALLVPIGQILRATQQAAMTFFREQTAPASLTLLLPSRPVPWDQAGDLPAARMLVSTLAVEWGFKGLRINALEISDAVLPTDCLAMLRFVAGAYAQYMTGQTLCLGVNAPMEAA